MPDPEIPTVSVIDLGIISGVEVKEEGIKITMTPTFSGCPAIKYMTDNIKTKVEELLPGTAVEVEVDFDTQWTTNKITDEGRRKLQEFGLAPPKKYEGGFNVADIANVNCPYCNSENTTMNSAFGPTLCRATHYCFDCLQAFEQFKPL